MKKIILLVCAILCSCIGSTFATKYVAITTDDPNRLRAQNIAIYPNMPVYDMGAFVCKEAFKKSF